MTVTLTGTLHGAKLVISVPGLVWFITGAGSRHYVCVVNFGTDSEFGCWFIKHNAIPVLVCAVLNCACLFLFARYTTTANFSDPDEENTASGDDAENTDYERTF